MTWRRPKQCCSPEAAPSQCQRRAPASAQTAGGTERRRGRVTAILGSASRDGSWLAAADTVVTAIAGMARIDLRVGRTCLTKRSASASSQGLRCVSIIVPPEMDVADSGTAVLGIRSICGNSAGRRARKRPVLLLTDRCVLGVVRVRRKARDDGPEAETRRLSDPHALRHQHHAEHADGADRALLAVPAQPALERLQQLGCGPGATR